MRIDELEKYLENILATDYTVRASQDKIVALNNMLATCRNILSLENVCNSETINDNYKFFMSSSVNAFSTSFTMYAQQRLAEFGINGMAGGNFAPMQFQQPMPMYQPMQQPMPQQMPMYQPMPQPQPMPQAPVAPVAPVAPAPAPAPVAPAPAPAPAPVAAAPTPAPVAPAPVAEPTSSSLDEPLDSGSDSSSSSSFDMDAPLPGMGGGDDGPAEGRDFLLSILSKK